MADSLRRLMISDVTHSSPCVVLEPFGRRKSKVIYYLGPFVRGNERHNFNLWEGEFYGRDYIKAVNAQANIAKAYKSGPRAYIYDFAPDEVYGFIKRAMDGFPSVEKPWFQIRDANGLFQLYDIEEVAEVLKG